MSSGLFLTRAQLGYDSVEAAGESFELAVEYTVEVSGGGEELDVSGGELLRAAERSCAQVSLI